MARMIVTRDDARVSVAMTTVSVFTVRLDDGGAGCDIPDCDSYFEQRVGNGYGHGNVVGDGFGDGWGWGDGCGTGDGNGEGRGFGSRYGGSLE